jgi:hypothetical protein
LEFASHGFGVHLNVWSDVQNLYTGVGFLVSPESQSLLLLNVIAPMPRVDFSAMAHTAHDFIISKRNSMFATHLLYELQVLGRRNLAT